MSARFECPNCGHAYNISASPAEQEPKAEDGLEQQDHLDIAPRDAEAESQTADDTGEPGIAPLPDTVNYNEATLPAKDTAFIVETDGGKKTYCHQCTKCKCSFYGDIEKAEGAGELCCPDCGCEDVVLTIPDALGEAVEDELEIVSTGEIDDGQSFNPDEYAEIIGDLADLEIDVVPPEGPMSVTASELLDEPVLNTAEPMNDYFAEKINPALYHSWSGDLPSAIVKIRGVLQVATGTDVQFDSFISRLDEMGIVGVDEEGVVTIDTRALIAFMQTQSNMDDLLVAREGLKPAFEMYF